METAILGTTLTLESATGPSCSDVCRGAGRCYRARDGGERPHPFATRPPTGLLPMNARIEPHAGPNRRPSPRELGLGLVKVLGAAALTLTVGLALQACNSDEKDPVITTSGLATSTTKTPVSTLPPTTEMPGDTSTSTTGEFASCREMVDCLRGCKLVPIADLDAPCVLSCIGTDSIEIGEFLYGLDLGLCAADLCAMADDTDTMGSCDAMGGTGLGIDLSEECISCIALIVLSDEPVEGCEGEFEACD